MIKMCFGSGFDNYRLRENIVCSKCNKRTTCFCDLTDKEKKSFLCKECKKIK